MRTILLIYLSLFFFIKSIGQTNEIIKIPAGVTYNYCDSKIVEQAKKKIKENLADSSNYSLSQDMLIVGPELWKRFKNIDKLNSIEGGNTVFHVDHLKLDGKLSQRLEDTKKIWGELRKEITNEYIIRKANEHELIYYWSVISFDIDEPLLIIETKEHNYILNFMKDDLKLMWLDEAPRIKSKKNNSSKNKVDNSLKNEDFKETKLDKIILLSSEQDFEENIAFDDIIAIIDKTSEIFEALFKNSVKSGKIMLHFEIKKNENIIQFSVKDDIDLEIMTEFEKQVNAENYPNSKKETLKMQLIYIVNSLSKMD